MRLFLGVQIGYMPYLCLSFGGGGGREFPSPSLTAMYFIFSAFILTAVGGGLLLGVITLLLIWRMRSRYKYEKEKENKVGRVSFKIPQARLDDYTITTQTRFPQQEQEELEYSYLDPEIYR